MGSRRGDGSVQEEDDVSGGSSDSEEEDDEGVLASEALDEQIQNTLEAIRRKDPRVYDETAKFYIDPDDETQSTVGPKVQQEKPMYLSDYHRRNLLEGSNAEEVLGDKPPTYAQQQDDLKNVIVKEMHAAASGNSVSEGELSGGDKSDDGFLVRKPPAVEDGEQNRRVQGKLPKVDVEAADRDPETYLSNFMSARAWVPSAGSQFQPFESDDDEEDRRAELFEEAYNLRFEDPNASNEKLLSHARDAAAKYSVRKETTNSRKKARDAERAKRDAAKKVREEEKARYRKLKVDEVEEKIKRIKDAAGLRGKTLQEQDWAAFLDEGWDDDRWEQEMKKRFGDDYYAHHDMSESDGGAGKRKRKLKKPKWDDDIDIADIVPEFDATEYERPPFSLTDDESVTGGAPIDGGAPSDPEKRASDAQTELTQKINKKSERDNQKKAARQERRKIEQLVDESMHVDETLQNYGKKHAGYFRYRGTSPTAYGLTPHDILMASDSQLNQYAGLKKMAAFRDSEKKRKDKKRLGKKARLRQWRKETFGNEQGPQKTFAQVLAGQDSGDGQTNVGNVPKGKKSRSKKGKVSSMP